MHGLQPKAKIKGNLPFHMRCSATLCKSCDLEKGQTFSAANSVAQTQHVKILDTAIAYTLADYSSTYHILTYFDPFSTCGAKSSTPIYLQNLAILC